MRKTFTYRLYLTKEQRRLLDQQLEESRWLYNRLLEARQRAWEERQESLRLFDQQAMLPVLKAERPSLARVQSQVLQNVAVRIDLAFKAFFRRCKAGETPGYPRFRGQGRYASFTFPQVPVGCHLDGEAKRLRVANVGLVKVILHRPLEGTPKTATISRSSTGKCYVSFSCEYAEPSPLPATGAVVGIDVGLKTFATLSTGQEVANPRFFRQEERALAKVQRAHRKRTQGTPQRATHRKVVVARVHARTRWRRSAFAYQHSRCIINAFDLLAVEDLSVHQMMHHQCLANSIQDAAWSQFTCLLAYKAAGAGRQCVAVNPAYTSQDCSRCGHRQVLFLADRTYTCPCCGLVLDRDRNASVNNASVNMLRLGQQSLASAENPPAFAGVVVTISKLKRRNQHKYFGVTMSSFPPPERSRKSNPHLVIRPAMSDDWPHIWPIYAQIVTAGETYAYPEPPVEEIARSLWMEEPPGQTVVAVEDDVVVGSAKMGPNRPGRGAHVATASFMVDPAQQGKGVGRGLGEYVLRWAREAGYHSMQFNAVVETNTAAVYLWQALGFQILTTVPEAFKHPRHGLVGLHVMYQRL
jgi:putative transposase